MTPLPQRDDDSVTILSGIAGNAEIAENVEIDDTQNEHGAVVHGRSPVEEGSPMSVDLLKLESESENGTVATTPASQKPSQDSVSPAARTLYALSQNMDDLLEASDANTQPLQKQLQLQLQQPSMESTRFPQKEQEAQEESSANHKQQLQLQQKPQPPDPQNVLEHHMYAADYTAIPLTMTSSSNGIGLVIQRASFLPSNPMTQCRVLRVVPGGVADKHGVQTDDWICHPSPNTDSNLVLAEFQEVQTWAKQSPFHATLLRHNQPTLSKQDSQKQETIPAIPASPSSPDKDELNPLIYPFCRLCNHIPGTKKPSCHHSWCPYGPFFQTNGANEILERIEYGRANHCTACQIEYTKGRLQECNTHSTLCRTNQEKESPDSVSEGPPVPHEDATPETPKKAIPSESLQQQIATGDEKQKLTAQKQSSKRQTKQTPKAKESQMPKPSNPFKQNSKMAPRQKKSSSPVPAKSNAKATSKSCVSPVDDSHSLVLPKKKKRKTSTTLQDDVSASTIPHINRDTPTSIENQEENPQEQVKCHGSLKPAWVSVSRNPWGPEGYIEGDVLLYGPPTGIGHHDVMLLSPRFAYSPFSTASNYRITHQAPEEGFAVLSLMRDPMAQTPWGFTVVRDEFGHACLVESVTEFSPAASATFLGDKCKDSLAIHDMVLMINGQTVCGMTEVAFQVELETSGPCLTLVVSRYRHSNKSKAQAAVEEQNIMQSLDTSCMDNRIVGWHEIGIGSRPVSFPSVPLGEPTKMEEASRHDSVDDASSSRSEGTSIVASTICHSPDKMEDEAPDNVTEAESNKHCQDGWENDLNTWNGCICGKIHRKSSQVFWLQCDACGSWFDVSSSCVGFSMEVAESKEQWHCPACGGNAVQADLSVSELDAPDDYSVTASKYTHRSEPERGGPRQLSQTFPKIKTIITPDTKKGDGKCDSNPTIPENTKGHEAKKVITPKIMTPGKMENMPSREKKKRNIGKPQGNKARRNPTSPIQSQEVIKEPSDAHDWDHKPGVAVDGNPRNVIVLQKGDLVYVEPHAWPGWNCQGGIGHITKTTQRSEEEEEVAYDVRFVVGYSNKGIGSKFVRPYSF